MGVAVFIGAAFAAAWYYKITDKKLERVRYFLEKHRAGEDGALTEEELAERDELVATLAGGKIEYTADAAGGDTGSGEIESAVGYTAENAEEERLEEGAEKERLEQGAEKDGAETGKKEE